MATITREQVAKFNARCHNGFELDVWHVIRHGEKDPCKRIPISETTHIKAQVTYYQVKYGVYEACLHLSLWHDRGTVWASSGLGKWIPLGEPSVTRRNYNKLADLTERLSDEFILGLAAEHMGVLTESRIL